MRWLIVVVVIVIVVLSPILLPFVFAGWVGHRIVGRRIPTEMKCRYK